MLTSLSMRILNRLSLRPSRHSIPHEFHTRWLDVNGCRCELFCLESSGHESNSMGGSDELHIVKFIGAAGRAENLSDLTLGGEHGRRGRIWVANPPGYGNSQGRATLQSQIETARAVYQSVREWTGKPPFLAGDSLGGAIAICLAAEVKSPGLIVRDPPPIRQLITTRFGQFGRFARYFAEQVPNEVDAMRAAPHCRIPAVFVSSRKDRIVPTTCQDELMAAYGGPLKKVMAHDAQHVAPLVNQELIRYRDALRWLVDRPSTNGKCESLTPA